MKLSQLCRGIPLEDHLGQDVEIPSVTCDTRTLSPGGLFAAFQGEKQDGNDYIAQALSMGAAAVLCETPPPYAGPWLVTEHPRVAFGCLCANWFRRPGDSLTLIGVTGTNGKTSTAHLLHSVLEQILGTKVGLIGTNGNRIGEESLPALRTTPDAYQLHGLLARMQKAGCSHAVMEVSSHGLALDRTAGLHFAVGIFTNLTQDHLDFHGTMENYYEAKAKLFSQCRAGCLNEDDPAGKRLLEEAPCPVHSFGLHQVKDPVLSSDGVSFEVCMEGERMPVQVPIPGLFTVYNALGVLSCCSALGLPLRAAATALERVPGIRGRAEIVPTPAPFTVMIDYAHTPDALKNILLTLREGKRGRLLCLFGCGGDRDASKRPRMGAAGAELADFLVLTSDNPRSEEPERIMDEVASGFPAGFSAFLREPDRRVAIRTLLAMGRPGDVLLLAGKGHETEQEIGGVKIHLDEREEIASFFAPSGV